MGTWGAGNLDNDYALDELGDRADALIRSLLERAQRPTSREGDEYDYTTLFVEFEIVFAFEAAGLLQGKLPAPAAVRELASSYVADWERYIEKLKPTEEHRTKRRAVIVESFERFAAICEKHGGEGALPGAEPTVKKPSAKKPSANTPSANTPSAKTPPASTKRPSAKRPSAKTPSSKKIGR